MRILFMATPAFACPSLELLSRKERLVGVITQPPRPSGRRGEINPSPVERLAKRKYLIEMRNIASSEVEMRKNQLELIGNLEKEINKSELEAQQ